MSMPAMALAPRPQSAKVLLTTVLTLFGFPAAAQQLGTTFALADQQTAVAHVVPGQFLRVRLKDGSRTGGPLIQATPVAFTLGPSVAFGDEDSRLYLGTVDSMWVRVYSTRRGMVIGASSVPRREWGSVQARHRFVPSMAMPSRARREQLRPWRQACSLAGLPAPSSDQAGRTGNACSLATERAPRLPQERKRCSPFPTIRRRSTRARARSCASHGTICFV